MESGSPLQSDKNNILEIFIHRYRKRIPLSIFSTLQDAICDNPRLDREMAAPSDSGVSKGNPRLRKACDFCRRSKVKCTGESPCSRCSQLDVPCQYGHTTRMGKPKGCRNKKTIETLERLRQQYALESLHPLQDGLSNVPFACTSSSPDLNGFEDSERCMDNLGIPELTGEEVSIFNIDRMRACLTNIYPLLQG